MAEVGLERDVGNILLLLELHFDDLEVVEEFHRIFTFNNKR